MRAQGGEQRLGHADDREHVGLELALQGLGATIEQRAHGAVAGVVDQHIQLAHLSGQLRQGRAIVDVQLHGLETGRCEGRDVFGTAGAGPYVIAGDFEGIGQGTADAAGATGDKHVRHGAILGSG